MANHIQNAFKGVQRSFLEAINQFGVYYAFNVVLSVILGVYQKVVWD